MRELFIEMSKVVENLFFQDYATHTIHELFFSLRKIMPIKHAALVLKDRKTDALVIKNRYNLSESCCRSYKRPVGTAVIGKVMYTDEILIVDKNSSAEDYEDMYIEKDYHSVVVLRVCERKFPSGFIALYFDEPYDFSEDIKVFFLAIARLVSEAIFKEEAINHLNELRRFDVDTQVLYCNYFNMKLKEEFDKGKRHETPVVLVVMDIDNYKEILNSYGTEVARELLVEVSDALKSCIRAIDFIGRYGADEFILCLPDTSVEQATVVIERFVKLIKESKFTKAHLTTSLSIGMSGRKSEDTLESFMKNAQVALYNAKVFGKGLIKIV
ncbi:MAG: sensor domain-containing diguanylate cyclase [Candidatus Magnetoovum sp. WYHC-5]|nr:sensor domain-containing diguanylate cyclase [Candidatus Magnetoovum sp. WYHC-5]